ncbi:hypothetical protein PHYBOEH_006047 [Phytophthora boehmeriae]|uniref:PH domain-containing protein n=1 Tax=Phytophthora boehmeriae TaxID=109152 RepID=A0A8T1WHY2_9STRA|nr:hypothetical protein PHYBOEH_006047 [Phytophthora boehmeriae]
MAPSSSSARSPSRPPSQSTVLLSAYLFKQSDGKWKPKRWNQRWFVLDRENGLVRYFRNASPLEIVPFRQNAHGVVGLKQPGVSLVVQGDLPNGAPTPFCFTVLADGQKELRLCAETNAEFRQWTGAISAIISPSRTASVRTPAAAPTRNLNTFSSSPVALGPMPSSPAPSPAKEEKLETVEQMQSDQTTSVGPWEIITQLREFVRDDTRLLIALNPVIVLVRFGDASTLALIVLLANALVVWLLCEPLCLSSSFAVASRQTPPRRAKRKAEIYTRGNDEQFT